jgi:flagellin
MLIRLRELAMQAASDTVGDQERGFANKEFQSIKEEIQRVSDVTEFNGTKLLNGQMGQLEFQIGVHNNPTLDRVVVDGKSNDTSLMALQIFEDQIGNKVGAQMSLEKLDFALNYVNGMRANLGAVTNRLQSTINSIAQNEETITAANSRIRDADIAEESSELTRNNILMQSGVSVLSQANANSQMALKLLG